MQKNISFFFLYLIFSISVFSQTVPVNSNSTKATRDVLNYLWNLSYGSTPGVIVGQNCGHGTELVESGYQKYVGNLANQTGKYIGMLSLDYEFMKIFSVEELLLTNTKLIEYWNAGGLITLNYSPLNILDNNSPAMSQGGAGKIYRILPGGDLRNDWLKRLDGIAAGLKDLQNNGVVVLWRPMQESNGPLFWYATAPFATGGQSIKDFIALYRDMYDYFTNVKKLNNLLWVFAPTGDSGWSAFPYPGDEYVDIVAGTRYGSALNVSQNDYNNYKKPIGMSEYGWATENTVAQDNLLYEKRLAVENPQFAYWVSWSDWSNVKMSIIANKNSTSLMNHANIITRDELPVFKMTDSITPSVPEGLATSKLTNTKFTLSWNASVDDIGVVAYEVFKNGVSTGFVKTNLITVSNLIASTSYSMAVMAIDAEGNKSDTSAVFEVKTDAFADSIPPSIPTGLAASEIAATSFSLSWQSATDNMDVALYEIFKNGKSIGKTTSSYYKVTGLTDSTSYEMTVIAIDEIGNKSALSTVLKVTTAAVPASNIAYKKKVKVSSTTGTYVASNAVDANQTTRWESAWTNNEWIYVDLGAFYKISRVILTWEAAYASTYKIQTSGDAINWIDLFSTTKGNGATDDISLTGVGRYVKILMSKRATSYGNSLFEIVVNGSPSADTVASSVIKISENKKMTNSMYLYPNPTKGNVNVVLSKFFEGNLCTLDISGRVIKEVKIDKNGSSDAVYKLDLSDLNKGIYLVSAKTDTYSEVKKLVLE